MSEIKRKLASIRRIDAIEPIEGADKIVVAKIGGWQVVTQKTNYQVGDLCVFFEIDSFLPVEERFEWLRKTSYKKFEDGTEGFRIKTIKLRGQLSQGLSLPLSDFPELANLPEGEDVTDLLKVIKYDPPVPVSMSGIMKGRFPSFIPKTDQERIQNCIKDVSTKWKDHKFEATLKLDGSSMTVYYKDGDFGVCSRNLDLIEDDENIFWKTAKSYELDTALRTIGRNIAIQGELMGPGIQGNREAFSVHRFFVFDIYDIDKQRYFTRKERQEFLDDHLYDLDDVPHINDIKVDDFTLEDFLEYADRKSINNEVAEGVVFKSLDDPSVSFKVINNKFLLGEE